ncbi:MAG: phosphatase PAP2 family protein [Gammaproteobacteria bacterium]|nr:phosphatase PAP2 family protein [Gammaproteobacteria bacterium]
MTAHTLRFLPALALLGLQALLAGCAVADASRPATATVSVDLTELLPPPPAPGSAADREDLDAVIRTQAARTPASIAAAKADALVTVFRFDDVLGPAFTASRLPRTTAFFRKAALESTAIGRRAKDYWNRPRPYRASERVTSIVGVSTDGSYPSGHAMYGCMAAVLLGLMVPEQRTALLERGSAYARNRVVGGVHYPTDVEAGCTAGRIVAAVFLQSPEFRAELATARDETRQVLGLAALAGTD